MSGEQAGAKPAELSCPGCGEIVYAGERFCEECGHRLDGSAPETAPGALTPASRAGLTMRQGSASTRPRRVASAGPCAECGGTAIDGDGYCETCGLRQPAGRDHVEIELPAPATAPGSANGRRRVAAAGVSDRGLRYPRNEDAIALVRHASGIAAVVSDGVGSSPHPEDASRRAAETGAAELAALLDAGTDAEDATRTAALKAAEAVAALAGSPHEAPSCTYVSAVTRDGSLTVGWVGDSRAYWLAPAGPGGTDGDGDGDGPDTAEFALSDIDTADLDTGDMGALGPSRQLTEDDSWAAIMVAQGALTEAEAEAHPNAHVITAWLGADAEEVLPHVATFRPSGPGTLLVCSDGLWNYFPRATDLAALLSGPAADPAADPSADPLGTARALVRHALDAGGRDNITVAVIPVPPPLPTPSPPTPEPGA